MTRISGEGWGAMAKRTNVVFLTAVAVAFATYVWAQGSSAARLKFPGGEQTITIAQQGGQPLFPVDRVLASVGGRVEKVPEGFKAVVGGLDVAFAADSRYAVVRDKMIEMPQPPMIVEGRPFAPLQFFSGFLRLAAGLDAVWDQATGVLELKPVPVETLEVQPSVVDVQNLTKIVLQLSGPTEYTIVREAGTLVVRLVSPIRVPVPEQKYDSAYVSGMTFGPKEVRIELKTAQVAADSYKLENPFRIVLDLRQAAAPVPVLPQTTITPRRRNAPGIHTIVIDPGHGGKEVGAVGPGGLFEKDVTLAICRKLAARLESTLHTRVVLTRESDEVVPLDQRTALANQYQADLFLSVHLNSSVIKGAKGSETYFLSADASDELARHAADRENSGQGRQGNSELNLILWDLAQQSYLNESSRLAQVVQEEMNQATGVLSRGVKQAPFKVLVGATMPAALVEVGFISNPDEEKKLTDGAFQDTLVAALTKGIARYKSEYEVRIGVAPPAAPPAAADRQEQAPSPSLPASVLPTRAAADRPGV
ncbi:MAG: N-acetylmuramoyl-L-alanine amidase [Acidobacteriota bacterium]